MAWSPAPTLPDPVRTPEPPTPPHDLSGRLVQALRGNENRTLDWQVTRGHWPEWSVPGWWVAAPCTHSEALVRHQGGPYGSFLRCSPPPGGWPAPNAQ